VVLRCAICFTAFRSRCFAVASGTAASRLLSRASITLGTIVAVTVVTTTSSTATTRSAVAGIAIVAPSIAVSAVTFVTVTPLVAAVIVTIVRRAVVITAAATASAAAIASIIITAIVTVAAITVITTSVVVAIVAAVTVWVVAASIATTATTATAFVESGRTARTVSLGWTEVLSGGRRARAGTTRLLDAQGATIDDFTLQSLPGRLSLFRSDHLDEAESTRLLGVRIAHNLALLHITILLKHLGDLIFSKTRVDSSNEEVRSWVHSTIIVLVLGTRVASRAAVGIAVGRSRPATTTVVVVTSRARGGAAVVTFVARRLVLVTIAIGGFVVHRGSRHCVRQTCA
jgi:hypothetical protein